MLSEEELKRKCIVCQEPIHTNTLFREVKNRRQLHALTCRRKCARIYNRVSMYCKSKDKSKVEMLKKRIKELERM